MKQYEASATRVARRDYDVADDFEELARPLTGLEAVKLALEQPLAHGTDASLLDRIADSESGSTF